MSDLLRQYGPMLYEMPFCVKLYTSLQDICFKNTDLGLRSKIHVMRNKTKSSVFFSESCCISC